MECVFNQQINLTLQNRLKWKNPNPEPMLIPLSYINKTFKMVHSNILRFGTALLAIRPGELCSQAEKEVFQLRHKVGELEQMLQGKPCDPEGQAGELSSELEGAKASELIKAELEAAEGKGRELEADRKLEAARAKAVQQEAVVEEGQLKAVQQEAVVEEAPTKAGSAETALEEGEGRADNLQEEGKGAQAEEGGPEPALEAAQANALRLHVVAAPVGCGAVGLLDLPDDVLRKITAGLGTFSLAAVRLTCQALRRATANDRRQLVIHVPGWYTVKARASPRVLSLMHDMETAIRELDEGGQGVGREGGRDCGPPGHKPTRAWMQTKFLADIAPEIESFRVGALWRFSAEHLGMHPTDHVLCQPHVLLSQTSALTCLCVERWLDSSLLYVLVSLPHLACLELTAPDPTLGHRRVMQQLRRMPALSRLSLNICSWTEQLISLETLARLAFSRGPGLHQLALSLTAEHLLRT